MLKKDWIEKIRPLLEKSIEKMEVSSGKFLDRKSIATELFIADFYIPETSPKRKILEELVDELPLYEFVTGTISTDIYRSQEYKKDSVEPLTAIENYADPSAAADRLLAEFENLPFDYVLSFKLPSSLTTGFPDDFVQQQIGRDIWLRRGGDDLEAQFPLESVPEEQRNRVMRFVGLEIFGSNHVWKEDEIYMQLGLKGFVGPYGGSNPYRAVIDTIKSFFGLLIALRGVSINPTSFEYTPKIRILLHKEINKNYELENRLELDEDVSTLLNRMICYNDSGKVDNEETIQRWFFEEIKKIENVFQNESYCSNILLASQWLFDSYSTQDSLYSYIRSMIVMEIMLGDERQASELSISDIISNRCAYLIGSNFENRTKIMSDIKQIYGIRSSIVHRGKSRLSLKENTLMRRLQWLCNRVIAEEIKKIPPSKTKP